MNCTVIVPAAGVGKRFGEKVPKQYIELSDIPIIIRSLQVFDKIEQINNVILVIDPEWQSFVDNKITKHNIKKLPVFVQGGKERQDSVYNTINLPQVNDADIILVHDAVRPLASFDLFLKIINAAEKHGAAIPGLTPMDTIKTVNRDCTVDNTISRNILRYIQTPQGFRKNIFIEAYKNAKEKKFTATDDASLVEYLGYPVFVIEGEQSNIKITTLTDLTLATTFFNAGSKNILNKSEK